MAITLEERLAREVEHGGTQTAVHQAEYGWASPAGQLRRQRRIQFLVKDLPRSTKVLEVGAGTGLQTMDLLKYVDDITGIDISPDLLKIAETRAPGGKYAVGDAHAPAFEAGSFDAILGVSILHHLEWGRALKSYYTLLKPGGVMRFSEPNLLNPQIYLQKNIPFLKQLAGDSPDEYAFTKWQIERSLREAGFKKYTVQPFEFLHPSTPESWIPFVSGLESFVSKTPLVHIAGSLLIEARKEG